MGILESSAPLLTLVAPLPFAVAVFSLVVRSSERRENAAPMPAIAQRPWQFRLADAGFLMLYVALAIVVAQWLARESALREFSTAATHALAALLAVWLWLVGVRLLWRGGVERGWRRLAVLLVLPLGLACAVYLPALVVLFIAGIGGLLFLPEESAVSALVNGLLILASVYGLVVTRRVIGWAVARDGPPRVDPTSPIAAEVRDV
jgi:hypothetical protein